MRVNRSPYQPHHLSETDNGEEREGTIGKKIQAFLKNVLDPIGALVLLLLLSPFWVVLAILIKLDTRGPLFFKQKRVGKNGKPFTMVKFRSMVVGAESLGLGLEVAHNDPRITRMGKFLRAWSLDELPQLINVLRGEMSLVGPRPPMESQYALFSAEERRRASVKPGITGYAQVKGRNEVDWKERIKLDIWYVNHWNYLLDLQIIWKTLGVVLRREGLYGRDGIARTYTPEPDSSSRNDPSPGKTLFECGKVQDKGVQ